MTEFFDKVRETIRRVEAERGQFSFVGLFMRHYFPGDWHFVAAAPWIDGIELGTGILVEELEETFGRKVMLSFAGVKTFDPRDRALHAILAETGTVNRRIEMRGEDLFDLGVKRAIIFRALPRQAERTAKLAAARRRRPAARRKPKAPRGKPTAATSTA